MMKKSKKRILCGVFAAMLLLSGCNIDEFVPASYGAWEGNYLYAGNGRCKTTGEDFEQLVESLTYGGETYELLGRRACMDYAFDGDELYLCLQGSREMQTEDSQNPQYAYISALVKYHLQTKETTYVHVIETDGYNTSLYIDKILPDKIFLSTSRERFIIDGNGNLLEMGEGFDGYYHSVGDKYLVKHEGSGSFYRTWENAEEKQIADSGAVYYSERGDGFFVEDYGLSYYDIATSSTVTLCDNRYYQLISDIADGDYFMTYTPREVTYKEWVSPIRTKQRTATLKGDCVLYKIVYDGANTHAEKVLQFDKDKSYTNVFAIGGGKMYARESWYETASGCQDGGSEIKDCVVDLQTGKVTHIDNDDGWRRPIFACKDEFLKDDGQRVGEYTYFIRREEMLRGMWSGPSYCFVLSRYDGQKIEAMQFFGNAGAEELMKWCMELWDPVMDNMEEQRYSLQQYEMPAFEVRAY